MSESPEVFVSYSHGDDDGFVDQIEEALRADGRFSFRRDKNDLEAGAFISEYMNRLGDGQLVIIVVSPRYLESPYCMRELLSIYRCQQRSDDRVSKDRFRKAIVPIYREGVPRLDEWEVRLELRERWKAEYEKLSHHLPKAGAETQAHYRLLGEFVHKTDDLLAILGDVKVMAHRPGEPFNLDQLTELLAARLDSRPPQKIPWLEDELGPVRRVFLSYAESDRARVEPLRRLFGGLGFEAFVDRESIPGGSAWKLALQKALDSADALIVLWSKAAAQSDWVRWEYEYFLEKSPEKRCIPLSLDTTSLPEVLSERQEPGFLGVADDILALRARLERDGVSKKEIDRLIQERLAQRGLARSSNRVSVGAMVGIRRFVAISLVVGCLVFVAFGAQEYPIPGRMVSTDAGEVALTDMVEVPAGEFFMGCKEKVGKECDRDEVPGRTLNLPGFYIDRTEVSVDDYAACVRADECTDDRLTGNEWPGQEFTESPYCNWKKDDRGNHPINCVDWNQAKSYCEWKGKRLPTEAEWEKAARGSDGLKYPWGNETASCLYAVMDDGGLGCGKTRTWPVDSKPEGASPYGALNMAGNVWEWTSSWYGDAKKYRVPRGGSWCDDARRLRASNRGRDVPSTRSNNLGFRCASRSNSEP